MLNKPLIGVLQALTSIAPSAVLKFPTTILNSSAGDIIVQLNVKKLDDTEFNDFGIYNLPEFLSTFKLFDDYSCIIEDGAVKIDGNGSSLQYLCTNITALENHNKAESLFDGTEAFPTVAEFSLTKDDVKMIKAAASVFKDLGDVIFKTDDRQNTMEIRLGSTNNFNAKSNSFSINKNANTSKEFEIKIPSENFIALPMSDYNLEIKYNESKSAFRIIVRSTEIDMKILLAIKK